MKLLRLMTCVALLGARAALAHAEPADAVHMTDAAWVKDAGDRLARCAGTYRGAAAVLRRSGQAQSAAYAESVGSGALFAAYLLFTSPTAVEAKVLDDLNASVHIEALAWGTKRNFMRMDADGDPAVSDALRTCTRISALQSQVLRSSLTAATPAVAEIRPAR